MLRQAIPYAGDLGCDPIERFVALEGAGGAEADRPVPEEDDGDRPHHHPRIG